MAAEGNPELNVGTGSHSNGGEEGESFEMQAVGEKKMRSLEREIYLRAELYADEGNDSPEIKRKKRMARTALTLWTERREIYRQAILQNGSEMRSVMNEVYQFVGLYSVFVGVALTAVATSSRLECQHLWSPVGLSLFAYFMLVVVAFKFNDIRAIETTKVNETAYVQILQRLLLLLSREGYAVIDFGGLEEVNDARPHRISLRRSWRNAIGLIVPLTIFTAGLMFSLVHILCWS